MIRSVFLAAAVAGLAFAGGSLAAPPARKKSPAPRINAMIPDWTRTVHATFEGGFQMGNPSAPVKVVEYGSLTCGHCAAFAREGMNTLVGKYVKSGKVSYEYRNYILNGLDVAASLLARCGGPNGFFPLVDKLYATQPQWMGRHKLLTQAQKDQLNALPEGQRLGRLAQMVGLTGIAAQHGITAAQADRCFAHPVALNRLGQMAEAASGRGVDGTPTFFLNGANVGPQTWETLEPILREAAR